MDAAAVVVAVVAVAAVVAAVVLLRFSSFLTTNVQPKPSAATYLQERFKFVLVDSTCLVTACGTEVIEVGILASNPVIRNFY